MDRDAFGRAITTRPNPTATSNMAVQAAVSAATSPAATSEMVVESAGFAATSPAGTSDMVAAPPHPVRAPPPRAADDTGYQRARPKSGSRKILDVEPPPQCQDNGGGEADDFGEDYDDVPDLMASRPKQRTDSAGIREVWHVRSQQPWQLGAEHCTLTILENACEELVQFDLVKISTHITMCLTCTNAQFDDLCKEQTGLAGTAQVNAAITQLFREAHEEIEKPPLATLLDDDDDFGEDDGRSKSSEDDILVKTMVDNDIVEERWHVKSQQPWQLGLEHCTLTIIENQSEHLVQFELLKNSTHKTLYVTCSDAQFDELLKEQTGLSGTAQVNAAISQLFQEAHEEIEKVALDPVDEFGEDCGDEFFAKGKSSAKKGIVADTEARWQIQSQQHWQLGLEHCTLTICENTAEGLTQYELLKHSTHTTMCVTCTNEQFDSLLEEQTGLSGTAQINAAITQLFQEAHEEIEKPSCASHDPLEEFGDDFGEEFSAMAATDTADSAAPAEASWLVKSQQPWKLGQEHCTLTILENASKGLVQFELLKNSTHTTMYVTCTNAQFEGLLSEQAELSGTARVNAAIAQMFAEAHAETEAPR